MRVIITRFDAFTNEKIQQPAILESKHQVSLEKMWVVSVSFGRSRVDMWKKDIERMMGRNFTPKEFRKIPTIR